MDIISPPTAEALKPVSVPANPAPDLASVLHKAERPTLPPKRRKRA